MWDVGGGWTDCMIDFSCRNLITVLLYVPARDWYLTTGVSQPTRHVQHEHEVSFLLLLSHVATNYTNTL